MILVFVYLESVVVLCRLSVSYAVVIRVFGLQVSEECVGSSPSRVRLYCSFLLSASFGGLLSSPVQRRGSMVFRCWWSCLVFSLGVGRIRSLVVRVGVVGPLARVVKFENGRTYVSRSVFSASSDKTPSGNLRILSDALLTGSFPT